MIKGKYGVDAPYAPALLALAGLVAWVLAWMATGGNRLAWAVVGAFFLAQSAIYLHTTLRGKFRVWESILDHLGLRGDENALDVGCGRGMVLIATARRLPTGTATGIDLWRSQDQSGNDPEVTRANAAANNVAERVNVLTGDMRELPGPSNQYNLVTANVAIQNIKNREERRQAVAEMARVTAPGGRIVIADIQYVRQYAADLEALGLDHVTVRSAGFNGWFGNPFYATRIVEARKPSAG